MARKSIWLLFLVTLTSFSRAGLAADSEVPLISLLRQKEVHFQGPAASGKTQNNLTALTDGKTTRFLELELTPGVAIDLTYQLPETSTCQQLLVLANTKQLPSTNNQLPSHYQAPKANYQASLPTTKPLPSTKDPRPSPP